MKIKNFINIKANGKSIDFHNLILDEYLNPFNKRIDEVVDFNNKRFTELQLQTDKNFLVNFLARVENGLLIDETELEHFYFTYDDYHKNNGNSYIDHKVEKLKKNPYFTVFF